MIVSYGNASSNLIRNMNKTNKKVQSVIQKLSSGRRINGAFDDAAGLAVSQKMLAQIYGLNQASRNLDDGINFVQVADGALTEVHSIYQHIRELSIQVSNGTYQLEDREAVDNEIQHLKQEADRIFKGMEFNSKKIWNKYSDERVFIGMEKVPAVTLMDNYAYIQLNNTNKEALPNNGKYLVNADQSGITIQWSAYNGNIYNSKLIEWPADLPGSHSFQLSDYLNIQDHPELTGINFNYSYHVEESASLQDVIDSLNATAVTSSPTVPVKTKIYTQGGVPVNGITFTASINYEASLTSEQDLTAYDTHYIDGAKNGSPDTNNLIVSPDDTDTSKKWEFEFEMPNIGTVKAVSNGASYWSSWKDPGKKWWFTSSDGTDFARNMPTIPSDGSLDSVLYALQNGGQNLVDNTNGHGGTIQVNFDIIADSPYSTKDGNTYNSVGTVSMYISVLSGDTVQSIKDKLSKLSGLDLYAGKQVTNAPETNISNTWTYETHEVLLEVPRYGYLENRDLKLDIQAGDTAKDVISIEYAYIDNEVLGVHNISVLTKDTASHAIEKMAGAINLVSIQRSIFGAYRNEMSFTKGSVDNSLINITDANSRISDADMAKESMEYIKQQILSESSQQLMQHVHQLSGMVLKLLQ